MTNVTGLFGTKPLCEKVVLIVACLQRTFLISARLRLGPRSTRCEIAKVYCESVLRYRYLDFISQF